MSKNIKPDERRTEIALARYTLILPIVRETCRRARHQMRKNIAATIHDFPLGVKGGVSVTTLDPKLAAVMEPRASCPCRTRNDPRAAHGAKELPCCAIQRSKSDESISRANDSARAASTVQRS